MSLSPDGPELSEVVDELLARQPESDIEPTLARVARVMAMLGDPQQSLKVIHITGTNGKTSTARMIEAMVRRAGLRTGVFSSPHLHSVTERIVIDGEPVSDEAFVAGYEDLVPILSIVDRELQDEGESPLTFFEVLTCLAFEMFADAPVDVAVLEVGLGGRWDATNLADATVAVITPVAVDHERWLGADPATIAAEKAGIIKAGSTVVVAGQLSEVDAVIDRAAATAGAAEVLRAGADFGVEHRAVAVGGQQLTIRGRNAVYADLFLPLLGAHQADNAAVAVAATESMLVANEPLDLAVVDALGSVVSPGRLEAIRREPTVLLDAAHNPAGVEALTVALAESFRLEHLTVLVSAMGDKDLVGMLAPLAELADRLILTRNESPRAASGSMLEQALRESGVPLGTTEVTVHPDFEAALAAGVLSATNHRGGLLVTGSVVTVAQARALLRPSVGLE